MSNVGGIRELSLRMWERLRAAAQRVDLTAGKVTLVTIFAGGFVFLSVFSFISLEVGVKKVSVDNVTTSVRVLNTPPQWTVDAQEQFESSVTVPSNVGTTTAWIGTGTDSNSDNYYLLICKTNTAPTPHSAAPPTSPCPALPKIPHPSFIPHFHIFPTLI
jgi:hypothetical protein